jgi:hypothetical protein
MLQLMEVLGLNSMVLLQTHSQPALFSQVLQSPLNIYSDIEPRMSLDGETTLQLARLRLYKYQIELELLQFP